MLPNLPSASTSCHESRALNLSFHIVLIDLACSLLLFCLLALQAWLKNQGEQKEDGSLLERAALEAPHAFAVERLQSLF